MKTLFVAGIVGWLISMSPAISLAQGAASGSWMPSLSPGQMARYRYVYAESGQGATTYSGYVDLALNPTGLYYREYRADREYCEVLYNRDAHQVLLFNHTQNRLDVFSQLPHKAVSFIPFPFQDEAIARVVELAPARQMVFSEGAKAVSIPGTLSKSMLSVPVQFRADLTPTAAGPKAKTFSIHAPDGEVASWAFTYEGNSATPVLPTTIAHRMAAPIMTPDERQRYQSHEVVPMTHWRPSARVIYTFVPDRPVGAGSVPSVESFLSVADEKTTVVDRRDMRNVVRFQYRKAGGDLEKQIAAAHSQGESSMSDTLGLLRWLDAGGYALLTPFVLGALFLGGGVWIVLRRSSHSAKPSRRFEAR